MVDKKITLFQKIRQQQSPGMNGIVESRYSIRIKIIIFTITLLITSMFFFLHLNTEDSSNKIFSLKPGDKWTKQTVIAQYSFPVYKDMKDYDHQVRDAIEQTPMVFIYDLLSQKSSFEILDSVTSKLINSTKEFQNTINDIFTAKTAKKFFTGKIEDNIKLYKSIQWDIRRFLNTVYRFGIIDTSLLMMKNEIVSVQYPPNYEKFIKRSLLFDNRLYFDYAKSELIDQVPDNFKDIIFEIIQKTYKPNLRYSEKLTELAKKDAVNSVAKTDGIVRQGEMIISKAEIITEDIIRKIKSYEMYKMKSENNDYSISMFLGNLGHAAIINTILIIYLIIIRKRIFADNFQVAILCCVIILISLLSWLSVEINTNLPIEYFIFLPGLSMLIAIVFDSRTAFYVTVTIALLLTGIRGNDYEAGTAMMFAGIIAAYTVRDIQSRTQIFKSMFFILIGLLIPIIAFALERSADFNQTLIKSIIALINSAISPMITFGFLYLLEKFTNITTDLKLEEYNNLSHPLLVKLNEIAPGSYQHSLSIAVLAEKCASVIEANKLLAKVGSLYHDIGKILKPEYFAENQLDLENKHDLLSPKRSVQAIRAHVTDGIRLAKEYKLPQRIIDFIPMHHGTFLIQHFYAKALELADGAPVHEEEFRYPGPKPNIKEAAIVMICDSAEAISRLNIKDKAELEHLINNIIQTRFLDGQFDECNLTLNDLRVIKEVCIKHLWGSSHQRVEYKQLPTDKSADEQKKAIN